MIRQYSNYNFPELDNIQINGFNTQGENIADNGGIKEAYKAYSENQFFSQITFQFFLINQDSWVANHGSELLLPGLNFTQRQLFWISAANVWCSKHRPQALRLSVITGVHSPDKFRVQVQSH